MNSSYMKYDSLCNFNFVDMVFLEGDANFRPWDSKAALVIISYFNLINIGYDTYSNVFKK